MNETTWQCWCDADEPIAAQWAPPTLSKKNFFFHVQTLSDVKRERKKSMRELEQQISVGIWLCWNHEWNRKKIHSAHVLFSSLFLTCPKTHRHTKAKKRNTKKFDDVGLLDFWHAMPRESDSQTPLVEYKCEREI